MSPKKHKLDHENDLWLQQPGESPQAYEAFCTFRDLPRQRRTQNLVALRLGKSGTIINRWAHRWSWYERVLPWDREDDRVVLEDHWDRLRDMSARQSDEAMTMASTLMEPARAIQKLMLEQPDAFYDYFMAEDGEGGRVLDFDRLDRVLHMVYTSARYLPMIAEMEHKARGIRGEVVEQEFGSQNASPVVGRIEVGRDTAAASELFAKLVGRTAPQIAVSDRAG